MGELQKGNKEGEQWRERGGGRLEEREGAALPNRPLPTATQRGGVACTIKGAHPSVAGG